MERKDQLPESEKNWQIFKKPVQLNIRKYIYIFLNNESKTSQLISPNVTYSVPSVPACAKLCSRLAFSRYLAHGRSASGSGCASCCRVP